MTTKIFEELPSRDNRPTSNRSNESGPTDMRGRMEKKVRQAVYDIRYRARREGVDVKQAYSQYMQNSSLNGQERNLVRTKIFGRPMAEDYNIEEFASNSVANALFKVFVEGVEEESILGGEYIQELNNIPDKKYKVRVTDKNGTSYVRYATRQKISDLRANPNIESVEMTEYGEPYEGERTGGKQTAAAKAGKDYDGDGKVESGAKEYRGSVHNAIQRKRGGAPDGRDTSSVKEDLDFFEEGKKKDRKFDVMRGKKNNVIINPETSKPQFEEFVPESAVSTAQQKFMGMVHAYKKGKMKNASPEVEKSAKGMSDTEATKFASTKHKGLPKHVQKEETACDSSEPQRDTRGDYAKTNVIKNKLRSALGVKNPMVMVTTEESEIIDERRREDAGTPRKPRDRSVEILRKKPMLQGLMTRSGKTLGQHEKERSVGKDRTSKVNPEPPANPPAKKLAAKKAETERQKNIGREMQSSRFD